MSPEDLIAMDRVGVMTPSPDGATIVYTVRRVDRPSLRTATDLWTVRRSGAHEPHRLTRNPPGTSCTCPVWSSDGETVFYLSNASGSSQIWAVGVSGTTGAITLPPYPVTRFPVGVEDLMAVDLGSEEEHHLQLLAFAAEVDVITPAEHNSACIQDALQRTGAADAAARARLSDAIAVDHLPARHWDAWRSQPQRRLHVFVLPVARTSHHRGRDDGRKYHAGPWLDLLDGVDADCPSRPFGSLDGSVNFAPGAVQAALCYRRPEDKAEFAWSTSVGIHTVPVPVSELMAGAVEAAAIAERRAARLPSIDRPSLPNGSGAVVSSPDGTGGCPGPLNLSYHLPAHHDLTAGLPSIHESPRYSPDGGLLAWLAMGRPGYESDAMRLWVRSTAVGPETAGANVCLSEALDVSFHAFQWIDARTMAAACEVHGRSRLCMLFLRAPTDDAAAEATAAATTTPSTVSMAIVDIPGSVSAPYVCQVDDFDPLGSPSLAPAGEEGDACAHIICRQQAMDAAPEIMAVDVPLAAARAAARAAWSPAAESSVSAEAVGMLVASQDQGVDLPAVTPQSATALTRHARAGLRHVSMSSAKEVWTRTPAGRLVHQFVLEPAGADPTVPHPTVVLLHGGPQGAFSDDFHPRWNAQVFAGAGFTVVMPNFTGSSSYGQAFCDGIRGDWGGAPRDDVWACVEAAAAACPAVDTSCLAVAGASYGGYLVNWLNACDSERLRAVVCHDGLFDLRAFYYATEELWFPEWDFKAPAFEDPEAYERHNPVGRVSGMRTPTLFVSGGKDFRVPETHAIMGHTALRRRGVDARLVVFPSENHWVLRPANSLRWHHEVLDWLSRWLRPGDSGSEVGVA